MRRLALLALLLAAPHAAASQPTPELEVSSSTEGGAGVGEPVTLRILWTANAPVDVEYGLLVPSFVEVQGDARWRIRLAEGERAEAELRLVATREAYWSAAVAPRDGPPMYPRVHVLHARTDSAGGAATAGHDASEVVPAREARLELTARALNATRVEYAYAAEKAGAWRPDEAIVVGLDAFESARADGPRAEATTSEELGPSTYAFRALRAYVQAKFERPDLGLDLAIPTRLVACRAYGFVTSPEEGFRVEELGDHGCEGARASFRPVPGLAPMAALAPFVALALAARRR